MASCRNCNTRLEYREIYAWVISGIESLECKTCGREIATSASLLIVYVFAAVPMVIALNYVREITQYFHRFIEVPEIVVVLLLVLPQAAIVYALGFVLASRHA